MMNQFPYYRYNAQFYRLNRYNRNNILDDYGEIDWEALVEKNPDCQVHLYELPEAKVEKNEDGTEQIIAGGMTTSKKDKRKVVEAIIIGVELENETNIKYKIEFEPEEFDKKQGCTGCEGYIDESDIIELCG